MECFQTHYKILSRKYTQFVNIIKNKNLVKLQLIVNVDFKVDFLRGNEQINCPYWHIPLISSRRNWISGTVWKIDCENVEESDYWISVLRYMDAQVLNASSKVRSQFTVGNEETRQDNNYFNTKDLFDKLSNNNEALLLTPEIIRGQDVIKTPAKSAINLLRFQQYFKQELHSIGFSQRNIKLWKDVASVGISLKSATTDQSGYFCFGSFHFLIGLQSASSRALAITKLNSIAGKFILRFSKVSFLITHKTRMDTSYLDIIFELEWKY